MFFTKLLTFKCAILNPLFNSFFLISLFTFGLGLCLLLLFVLKLFSFSILGLFLSTSLLTFKLSRLLSTASVFQLSFILFKYDRKLLAITDDPCLFK